MPQGTLQRAKDTDSEKNEKKTINSSFINVRCKTVKPKRVELDTRGVFHILFFTTRKKKEKKVIENAYKKSLWRHRALRSL